MSSRSTSSDHAEAINLTILCIVVMLILAWAVIKASELVTRQLIAHPHSPLLLWPLGVGSLMLMLTLLTGSPEAFIGLLVSIGALLAGAKACEAAHDETFLPQVSFADVQDAVLHDPWWDLGSARAA
jgi:hypothetical protein